MIRDLHISNYALISDITVEPCAGFNIITGETGAGKSIMMGALGLLQGHRVDVKSLGARDRKSVVKATFDVTPDVAAGVEAVLASYGIAAPTDGRLTLAREISTTGRSKATVSDTPVPLAALGNLTALLVDIHSQHQNQLLSDSAFQLRTIDDIAGNEALLAEYKEIYSQYRRALKKFADTREEIAAIGADSDYLEYQLKEFTTLDLREGEEEELEQQRETLANSIKISERLTEAAGLLSWNECAAVDSVRTALGAMRAASSMSDEYAALADRLESIAEELGDVADAISSEAQTCDDPAALEQIENRLSRIYALKSKHRTDSYDALLKIRDRIADRLAALADSDNMLRHLENEARALKRSAMEKAMVISSRRKEAAASLAAALTDRARPLGMPNIAVDIRITSGKLNPDGIDTVDFLFAFNKNQAPAPVARHASGGEISRVMLALKSITAAHRHLPTIIFDEIDTGVSGEVALRMGELMAEIARFMQVITITHLPQVASRGDEHFKVYKVDDDSGSHTHISRLDPAGRRGELALMLSGDAGSAEALAAADSLLKKS